MLHHQDNKNSLIWLFYVSLLCIYSLPVYSIPSYQCEQNGKTIYQAFPCANTDKLPIAIKQKTNEQDLITFSKQGEEAKVYLLLQQGTEPNAIDELAFSALFYALDQQHYSIAKLLIAAHANVNFTLTTGANLLMHFANKGDSTAVEMLLANSAMLETKNLADGNTALTIAANARQLQIVKLLLTAGADPNSVNNEGLTPIILALTKHANKIVNLLLANNANLDQLSRPLGKEVSITPLIHFATYGDEKNVLALLRYGANVNLSNEQHITPLAAAAIVGNLKIVKLLLRVGANTRQITAEPKLWQHIQSKRSKIAQLIIDAN